MSQMVSNLRSLPHYGTLVAVMLLPALSLGSGALRAQPAEKEAAAAEEDKTDNKNPAKSGELGAGRLIRIRLPLTGNADAHIKSAIERVVTQLKQLKPADGRRPTLVLELAPQRGHADFGEGTDFTRALSLANYLTSPEVSAVKTVAYIPRTIKGHGVLVALACDQMAMHPEAEIGEATIDEDASRAVDPKIVSSYQEIASRKSTVPQAIALGMVDRRLEVLKVETDQGTSFVVSDGLDALKKDHTIISQETLFPAGSLGSISGREGRDLGLLVASDTEALARGLGLPVEAVLQDQSMMGAWKPVMISLDGPLTRRKVHQVETLIGKELDHKVNWIGLTIDSPGGKLEDCLQLAETIAALDPNEVQTVAYVPVDASGGAALVALACDQIVMQPEAHLGGKGTLELDRKTLDAARDPIRESLAKKVSHSWSLIAATIDPDIELFTYQNTKTGEVRQLSEEEAKAQADAANWRKGARIKAAGEPLRLDSNRARDLEIASHVVDNFDEFKKLYGFEKDVRVSEPNWALEFVEALSSPALAVLLLVIGFVGIYIELHAPGVGIGGFVAALAFLLFFWSNFLHGTAEWLEVLLFLGGIFFLLLEVLVLPGLGVFGIGGGLMILASLVLASQTFVLPQTESQLDDLRHSLTLVAAATVIVIGASIALRRYLPRTPLFRTLMLSPPPEEELMDLDSRESLAHFSHLVGERGVATTNLMPTGKAEINGELVDVISEGLAVDRGSTIVVMKTQGNRVVVRKADA